MSETLTYPDVDIIWTSEDGTQRIVLAYEEGSTDVPYDDGSTPILVAYPWRSAVEQMKDRTSYEVPYEIVRAAGRTFDNWGDRDLFERYLRIFHGTTSIKWYDSGNTYVTFDTTDWREAMGLTDEYLADKPQFLDGTLANMDEVKHWIEGEVFYARLERKARWHKEDSDETREDWEIEDTIGGFYGYEWAVEGAKEHLLPVALTA